MSEAVEFLGPHPTDEVMYEQFDFLMEHYRLSRHQPELCAIGKARTCPNCVRYIRLMNLLIAPFATVRFKKGRRRRPKKLRARARGMRGLIL
jgi:hypothetical protein